MQAGTFGHVAGVGWVDYVAPKRRSAPVAIVRHALGKLPDLWSGWPYTWDCCPWCGGDCATPDQGEGPE